MPQMQFLGYEQAEDKRDQKLQILMRGGKAAVSKGPKAIATQPFSKK